MIEVKKTYAQKYAYVWRENYSEQHGQHADEGKYTVAGQTFRIQEKDEDGLRVGYPIGLTIYDYVRCCGIRELGAFYFINPVKPSDAILGALKQVLKKDATDNRWSLAHLTFTRKNDAYMSTGQPGNLEQPQWFLDWCMSQPHAVETPWIRNRNSTNDIKMVTFYVE